MKMKERKYYAATACGISDIKNMTLISVIDGFTYVAEDDGFNIITVWCDNLSSGVTLVSEEGNTYTYRFFGMYLYATGDLETDRPHIYIVDCSDSDDRFIKCRDAGFPAGLKGWEHTKAWVAYNGNESFLNPFECGELTAEGALLFKF